MVELDYPPDLDRVINDAGEVLGEHELEVNDDHGASMSDFFRGWRRKCGVSTLLVAVLFTVGWVRSVSIVDSLTIRSEKSLDRLQSSRNRLKWERLVRIRAPEFPSAVRTQWESHGISDPFGLTMFDTIRGIYSTHTIQSKRRFLGFEMEYGHYGDATFVRRSYWIIPYWAIVIPFMTISAYLLLRKWPPRSKRESAAALERI
jgi:hypothetical protein